MPPVVTIGRRIRIVVPFSSPALSAMELPVYDVWVLDCKTPASAAPTSEGATSE